MLVGVRPEKFAAHNSSHRGVPIPEALGSKAPICARQAHVVGGKQATITKRFGCVPSAFVMQLPNCEAGMLANQYAGVPLK